MISVSSTLADAINTISYRPKAKLVIRENRVKAGAMTDLTPSWVADTNEIPVTPHPQDVCYVALGYDKLLSVTEVGGKLKVTANISDTHTFDANEYGGAGIAIKDKCKPALYNDGSTVWVFYLDTSNNLKRGTIDLARALAGTPNANCVNNVTTVASSVSYSGALHAISDVEVAFIYILEGGISVILYRYVTGTWSAYSWDRRFLKPAAVITDVYETVFSAAAKLGTDYFFYLTMQDTGAIHGVKADSDFRWSDTFEAVPADLTTTAICNAVSANGYVHLACQFKRTDELALAGVRSFILRSDNGFVFTIDKYVLFTSLGYRFLIATDTNNVYGYASNRVVQGYKSRHFTASLTSNTELVIPGSAIKKVSGAPGDRAGNASIEIANGDEQYTSHPLLKRGAQADVYIGYETTAGDEYVLYMSCVITRVYNTRASGVRALTVGLLADGLWHSTQVGYPFYVEIEGKVAHRDSCDDLGNFYTPEKSGTVLDRVFIDFWKSEPYNDGILSGQNFIVNGGISPTTLTGDHSAGKAIITELFSDQVNMLNEVTVTDTDVFVEVFGWSRTVKGDTGPNDTVEIRLKVKDVNGAERIQTGSISGTDVRFPKSYQTVSGDYDNGSYPIRYVFANGSDVYPGEELLQAIIIFANGATTVACPEHIEIYGGIYAIELGTENTPWDPDPGYAPGKILASGTLSATSYQGTDVSNNLTIGALYCFELTGGWFKYAAGGDEGTAIQFANSAGDTYNSYGLPWGGVMGYSPELAEIKKILPSFGVQGEVTEERYARLYFAAQTALLRIRVQEHTDTDTSGEWADNIGTLNWTLREVLTDKSKLRLPDWDHPYIMFSSKPYNTFNFSLYAKFFYTSGAMPTDKEIRWGLIGFAEDALNYICARYNPRTFMMELVKVRGGKETVLASSYFVYSDALCSQSALVFNHRDGLFTIHAHQFGNYYSSPLVSYQWKASDGPLSTTDDVRHVGIYGDKKAMWFYVNGYSTAGCDGVIFLPGSPYTYDPTLPSDGYIKMGDVIYKYSGKAEFTGVPPVRNRYFWGPFQCRSTTGLIGGSVAWEITMFDWLRGTSDYAGMFVGSDNNFCRTIERSEWRISHDPNDVLPPDNDNYIRNRSRHFNVNLPPNDCGFENRMVIGSGVKITGVYMEKPLSTKANAKKKKDDKGNTKKTTYTPTHGWRDKAFINATDEIWVSDFMAVSGGQDQTIEDILTKLCSFAGTRAEFPGNVVVSNLSVLGKTVIT